MKRLNLNCFVFSLLSLLSLAANNPALALPSQGMAALGNQARAYSQTEHGRMYDKQNPIAGEDSQKEKYEKDDQAPTDDAQYGGTDQGGVTPSGGDHAITTQKPEPQAQKVKEQEIKKTLTQWSYKNIGNGVNKAYEGPPQGPPWYSYPPSRTITAKPQAGAAKAVLDRFFPKLPGNVGSAMPSNTIMQANFAATGFAAAELMNAPRRQGETAKSNMGAQQQEVSDAAAAAAENGFQTGMEECRTSLINVANEGAGTPTDPEAATKTHSQAIWMVQQIYKTVYIPMAILLLLPGAVLTNLKGYLAYGVLNINQDEDAVSPFSGILRSIIAIFLIPATQLFCSWSIDVGNAMSYEIGNYIQPQTVMEWMKEQTFNAPVNNAMSMPKDLQNTVGKAVEAGGGGEIAGKIDGGSEKASKVETQGAATRMMQMAFNMLNVAMNFGMLMLSAFQIVMICYLFLMGPIAAAFFAWPSACGSLFKAVFANWIDALINVSLWKFWWCVVILIMQTRIEWLQEQGIYIPNSEWEMAVYTAFMVILLYVPFVPFDYKPGEMVTKILSKAEELKAEGAKGGGNKEGSGGKKSSSHGNSRRAASSSV